jgi:Na+/H+ antiporter NhaD/arsenite permease-like protein
MPRWGFPVFCVVLGLVLAGAMWAGGQPGGWWVLGLFVAYGGVLFFLSPRSEVASLLTGEARDERQRSINDRATAATGMVLIWVLVIAFVVSVAVGSDLAFVFSALSALAGLTWLTALLVLTRRG